MNKTSKKSMPKFLISTNKKVKLTVQISQKTMNLIEDYQNFHSDVSGEKVALDELVSAVVSSALMSDKNFINWKRDKTKNNVESADSNIS